MSEQKKGGVVAQIVASLGDEVARQDAWQSVMMGFGTIRDKVQSFTPGQAAALDQTQAEELYRGDDMAALICDLVPEEAMQAGFDITVGEDSELDAEELNTALVKAMRKSGAEKALEETWIARNKTGGGAAWMLTKSGDAARPLSPSDRAIIGFHVFDKNDLKPKTFYMKPGDPKFGQPETFEVMAISGTEISTAVPTIHESRLLIMRGRAIRKNEQYAKTIEWWGGSELELVNEALRGFNLSWAGIWNLVSDSSQGVFKVKGLIAMLGGKNAELMHNRMTLLDMGRSMARSILVDAESESYERTAHGMSGLEGISSQIWLRLSAATREPVTKLAGQAPSGLSATGENDQRNHQKLVTTKQNKILRPALEKYIAAEFLMPEGVTKGIPLEEFEITFRPVDQPTAKETAELRKIVAETDSIYIDKEVLTPEEVATNRFAPTGYNAETTIDLEVRKKIQEINQEKALEDAEKPTPEIDPNAPPTPPGNVPPGNGAPPKDPGVPPGKEKPEEEDPSAPKVPEGDSGRVPPKSK